MAKTRTQLANRALEKLMVVGAGQAPSAEDTERAYDAVEPMSELLSAINVFTIADLDEIDEAPFELLADYLAYTISVDFGLPPDDGRRQRAEYMLRRLNAPSPTREVLKAEYF